MSETANALFRQEIEQFYATQMQTIDGGDVDGWAETFTEDAVFASNGLPEPGRGREVIRSGAGQLADRRAERGAVHRHLTTGMAVTDRGDGSAFVRSYVLVLEILAGAVPTLHASTVLEDELVRTPSGWAVRHRQVLRDDLRD